jgi:hypothetical protein
MEPSDRGNFDGFERQPPSLAARRLAELLALRLDAVVPRPFRVQADAGTVALHEGAAFDSSNYLATLLDWALDPNAAAGERGSFAWRVAAVSEGVLSSVQDGISEGTSDPWPPLASGGMAMPGTRTDGASVFLWYGPHYDREVDAVLSFAPIALAELLG